MGGHLITSRLPGNQQKRAVGLTARARIVAQSAATLLIFGGFAMWAFAVMNACADCSYLIHPRWLILSGLILFVGGLATAIYTGDRPNAEEPLAGEPGI